MNVVDDTGSAVGSAAASVVSRDPGADVRGYVAMVRIALADLPAEDVDELTGGLEADLGEQLSELPTATTLTSAFGAPDVYAAELRSAAGLPPRSLALEKPSRVNLLSQEETKWRATRDRWLTARPWLQDLRPVWWLLRGAIIVMLPLLVLGAGALNPVLWGVMFVAAIISFAWSRAGDRPTSTWSNRLTIFVNALALLMAFPALATWTGRAENAGGTQTIYVGGDHGGGAAVSRDGVWVNGEPATNLYAYDAEGNRLDRVRLFNQYGQAVAVSIEGLDRINQHLLGAGGPELPRRPNDGSFEVNRVVFPFTWGSLTGWEASSGGWEPPVKITSLAPGVTGPTSPESTPTVAPVTPVSPGGSSSPGTGASASPSPSASPTP